MDDQEMEMNGLNPSAPEEPAALQSSEVIQPAGEEPVSRTVSETCGNGPSEAHSSPFADSPYQCSFQSSEDPCDPGESAEDSHRRQRKNRREKKRRGGFWFGLVTAVLCLLILSSAVTAGLLGMYYHNQMELMGQSFDQQMDALREQVSEQTPDPGIVPADPQKGLTPGQVYNKNAAAVVSVVSSVNEPGLMGQAESSGSGFIISEDGYVVTNCHVVEGAQKVSVRDHKGQVYDAEIIGKDAANDIALLKIKGKKFSCVETGSSKALHVGDQVVAIGHPLGNQSAVLTVGYVSAKDQVIYTDGTGINMIQTDAAINSGNSGGPLFNALGQVVGITTAKYSGTTSTGASIEGVGYAIPMDDILDMLDDLKKFGYVKSGYLGVTVKNVSPDVQEYGLPMGAFVHDVREGYAAQKAGIRAKDVIIKLGGQEIRSVSDLTRALRRFEAGDEIVAEVWRAGKSRMIKVILDEKPEQTEPADTPEETIPRQNPFGSFQDPFFGILP